MGISDNIDFPIWAFRSGHELARNHVFNSFLASDPAKE